ncbi:MAG: sigma-70 family RNA polymerase sigma factor [Terracidiphilus sp.]
MSQLSQNTESRITSLGSLRPFDNPSVWRAEAERDLEIVAAVQAGLSAAFDELQRQYSRRLFLAILRITKNREDAEDALQDTFLRAFLALPQFEYRSSVYSWLLRIAINSALMILRRRRTRREVDTVFSVEGCDDYCPLQIEDKTPNPEQLCELRQRCNRVINAIQKLKPRLRAPIEIQMASQRSMEELARELNISVPAVKTRLFRARVQLAHHNSVKEGIGALTAQ